MLASLALPVAADGEYTTDAQTTTYTITIDKQATDREYYAYQIFTGNVAANEMTGIEWGSGVSPTGQNALYEHFELTGDNRTAEDVAKSINETTEARDVAETLKGTPDYLTNTREKIEYNIDLKKYQASGFAGGYYLIVDETSVTEEADAVSAYMMHVVRNVELTPKDSVPTMEKTVSDINDSIQDKPDSHKSSADYDIGDHVPFHIHITLGDNIDQYAENGYKIVITDTLSSGLTFDGKDFMTVTYGTSVIDPSAYTVSEVGANGTFTITFQNLFDMKVKDSESTITPGEFGNLKIDYTATLNSNAIIGDEGNRNTALMEFSNNPHGETMGTTPESEAIVFTYKLVINKVDENKDPLNGAEFKLEKKLPDGVWQTIQVTNIGENGTTFNFSGLDDGIYRLTETHAPSGHNPVDPMTFGIVATHEGSVLTELNGNKISGVIELAPNLSQGTLSTDVVNESGAILPSTGGVGTTIFYVAGGALVCLAVVLLITKKRMKTED